MANRGSADSRDANLHEMEENSPSQEHDLFTSSSGPPILSGPQNGAASAGIPTGPPGSAGANAPMSGLPTAPAPTPVPKAVEDVINSDIGINVLLTRLKQSISSARDFALFLKKRSGIEDEHAQGLRKLSRSTVDAMRRQDSRQGSYAHQFSAVNRVHDQMAENGIQFSLSLHRMHEDLTELSNNIDKGRKHWKAEGLANEKRVKDAESAMQKAKSRYDGFAEDYDRARTGDRSSGKVFGLKGPKSAAQHEEDLLKKVQNADTDYSSKVQTAKQLRLDNLNSSRPQAVKALQELITECDSALTLQLQKFATFNEKLLVSNGLVVSPMKSENTPAAVSMRDMVTNIDNERDLHAYISSQANNVPHGNNEIRYEKHPTLAPQQSQFPPQPQQNQQSQQQPGSPTARRMSQIQPTSQPPPSYSAQPQPAFVNPNPIGYTNQPPQQQRSSLPGSPQSPQVPQQGYLGDRSFSGPPLQQQFQQSISNGQQYPSSSLDSKPPLISAPASAPAPVPSTAVTNGSKVGTPTKPIFGVSLEDLYMRDGSAVPMVVYQCIQAIDSFGLEVEGIYRLSGSTNHIQLMKQAVDRDAARVDFRNPENFYHDVNSVAGLLKQFFRELPDPLLTSEHYNDFIEAARVEDPIVRRDQLHAVINSLPDPNYATLRALVLHLNRVQEHSQVNRMSTSNIAICIAPAMMGPHTGPRMADAGLQARVVDTILQNTYQIFDED